MSRKWTLSDLKKTGLSNNLHEINPKNNVLDKKYLENGKISHEKETIKTLLWVLHREGSIPEYVEELEFHPDRKFRFDWAIPSLKIAIEYEGVFAKKSRHTTISGYTMDCEKYNLAQISGWKVLRYTAKNYNDLSNDLKKLIKK